MATGADMHEQGGLLEVLKPTELNRVIDLVRQAGHDVSDWSNYRAGASKPAANPKYWYSWFMQPGLSPILLLWHDGMHSKNGTISKQVNARELAVRRVPDLGSRITHDALGARTSRLLTGGAARSADAERHGQGVALRAVH